MVCVEIILRSATHGMPKHNLILFYACSSALSALGGKSKASEKANKWKVIIHNRPGEQLKAGEMTFGCEILWATERETRKFPSRGSLRVSWARVENESQPIRCCESGFSEEFVKEFRERKRTVFPAKENHSAIFQMSCQTRIARIRLLHRTYRPIKRCKLRPKNNAKGKTINYDVFLGRCGGGVFPS